MPSTIWFPNRLEYCSEKFYLSVPTPPRVYPRAWSVTYFGQQNASGGDTSRAVDMLAWCCSSPAFLHYENMPRVTADQRRIIDI